MNEYINQFRHVEHHCTHLLRIEPKRAGKFVWGLNAELRSKVIGSNSQTLLVAIAIAIRLDEDSAKAQR